MTRKEFLRLCRLKLDDTKPKYLWPDDLLLAYANDAENEACRRARLIRDRTNDLCFVDVAVSDTSVEYDPRIIFISTVWWQADKTRLKKTSIAELEELVPGWRNATGSKPTHYYLDADTGRIGLYPATTVAGTLELHVVRLPLKPMCTNEDRGPEIREEYQYNLHHWVCHRAYMHDDENQRDEKRAAFHYQEFEKYFGPPLSAVEQEWINSRHGLEENEGLF